MQFGSLVRIFALTVAAVTAPSLAHAQTSSTGSAPQKSAAEVAQELANPNTSLGSLAFNLDYTAFTGDLPGSNDQHGWKLSFQPVLPIPLGDGVNFFVRPLVPIIFQQPIPSEGSKHDPHREIVRFVNGVPEVGEFDDKGFNLGDIGFDAAVGKTFGGRVIVVGGVVGTLPTATDEALGTGQWLLGPEFLVGVLGKPGFVGVFINHQWDVAGNDDFSTSITGGQYIYTINIKNGWQIQANPVFSYNHNAASGNQWTVPIGTGLKKTTVLGATPWKFGVEYWYYAAQADTFGPAWQLRFSVTPVIPLPW